MFPFDSDDSYLPFATTEMILPPKPRMIPSLDFKGLPDYESSEEGTPAKQESVELTPKQEADTYQASLDYITKYYSNCGPEASVQGNLPLDYSNDEKMASNPEPSQADDI